MQRSRSLSSSGLRHPLAKPPKRTLDTQKRPANSLKRGQRAGHSALSCVNSSDGRDSAGVPDSSTARAAPRSSGSAACVRFVLSSCGQPGAAGEHTQNACSGYAPRDAP